MKVYTVKNDKGETAEVDENRISEAEKDGYLPVVSNGQQEARASFGDLSKAAQDGFNPLSRDDTPVVTEEVSSSKPSMVSNLARLASEGAASGFGAEIAAGYHAPVQYAMEKLTGTAPEQALEKQTSDLINTLQIKKEAAIARGDSKRAEKLDKLIQKEQGTPFTGTDIGLLERYRTLRGMNEQDIQKAREEEGLLGTAAEVVGGIAPALVTGGASLAGNVGKETLKQGIKRVGTQGLTTGGMLGGLTGLGYSESDLTKGELAEAGQDILTGAAAGGVIGGAVPVVAKTIGAGVKGGINEARKFVSNVGDIGKRLDLELQKGIEGSPTTGNINRIKYNQDIMDDVTKLPEKVEEVGITKAKKFYKDALAGESKDVTQQIDEAIAHVDDQMKTYQSGPEADALKNMKGFLVNEKERLIQKPTDYTSKYAPKSEVQLQAEAAFKSLEKDDQYRNALNRVSSIGRLFDTAAKMKKGTKIGSLELEEVKMNIPKIADDFGMSPADAMEAVRDVARLNVKVPKMEKYTEVINGKKVTKTRMVEQPKELTRIMEKYTKPTLEDASDIGKFYIRRGTKIIDSFDYRPDSGPVPVMKTPEQIVDLMKGLRDMSISNPNKAVRKVGAEIDDIFNNKLQSGMTKEQQDLLKKGKDIYKTVYDVKEGLGNKAFEATKGSVAEKQGWEDIRRVAEGLEDVSVISPQRPIAEDVFRKIGTVIEDENLLPRLKEASTLSNLAEGQSGLVPTQSSIYKTAATKTANLLGRGINYLNKPSMVSKLDTKTLKMLAERTRTTSPQVSNFLENLSNVENHSRRNALMFAASQKAGLKEELDKLLGEEEKP